MVVYEKECCSDQEKNQQETPLAKEEITKQEHGLQKQQQQQQPQKRKRKIFNYLSDKDAKKNGISFFKGW